MTQQAEPVQHNPPPPPPPPLMAVRFGYLGWVGEFRHDPGLKIKYTDQVVVKTERGLEIGTPMAVSCGDVCPKCVRHEHQNAYVYASGEEYLQRGTGEVIRAVTAEDLIEQRRTDSHAKEKMEFCGRAAVKVGLDMHMIACEHLLGGERIIFYFTAEGRIDFRQLVRDLAHEYHTRIEMRQIGSRDEARIVADFEICGRECCCKNFLKVLRPVNMKMAKLQKATLDPTKVSGRCGRLRCCLRYEQQTYEELDTKLPGIGTRVRVEKGVGIIRDRQIITQLVVLDMGEGRRLAVPRDEILEILPPGEIGESGPPRRDTRPDNGAGDNGDVPVRRRPVVQEDAAAPVVPEGGKASEALPPQPGRPPGEAREGGDNRPGREGANGRDGRGERRPGRSGRGEGRSDRDGQRRGGRTEARPDNLPQAHREGGERPNAPERQAAQDPGAAPPADAAPAEAGSLPANMPANNEQSAREGGPERRRRRRGRRSRGDGPPRGDGQQPRSDNPPRGPDAPPSA